MEGVKVNGYYQQIISVPQLEDLLNDSSNTILLDASIPVVAGNTKDKVGWPEVKIANAQRFDLKKIADQTNALSYMMPTAEQFQQQVRDLGINNDSQIIVYDNVGIYSAPRAWWMFKSMGFEHVAVLDGGLPEWLAHGKKTQSAGIDLTVSSGNFDASFSDDYFCDKEAIKTVVANLTRKIFDARATKRFTGEFQDPRVGVRNGHIPTSISLPYSQLQLNGKFLSKAQLQAQLDLLISPDEKIIFSCGSGITACVLALAADICGYHNLTVYDGSWSDWGSDHRLAIETGES